VATTVVAVPIGVVTVEAAVEGTTVVATGVAAAAEGAEDFRQREGSSSISLSHRLREAHRVDGAPHLPRERLLPDAKENFPSPRPLGESVIIKPDSVDDKGCCTAFP
jgi:hypothetical protein